jgi:hypothetical protein
LFLSALPFVEVGGVGGVEEGMLYLVCGFLFAIYLVSETIDRLLSFFTK